MQKIFFYLFLLLACHEKSSAQHLIFNKLGVEQGLSQTAALCFAQDRQGFIWVGTESGLNRFDAKSFKIYKNDPEKQNSLSGNYILSLLSDSKGRLWIGTSTGLNLYDPKKDAFHRYKHEAGNPGSISNSLVRCLYEDSKGRIWVGTSGGLNLVQEGTSLHFVKTNVSQQQTVTSEDIRAIKEDHAGQLWISSSNALIKLTMSLGSTYLRTYPNPTKNGQPDPDYLITSIEEDKKGQLWLGTQGAGLLKFDSHADRYTTFASEQTQQRTLPSNSIRKIRTDKKGRLWIGTQEGLVCIDPESGKSKTYQHEPENKMSLSQNSVYAIFHDKDENTWIGTYYGGVNLVFASNTPFKAIQANAQKTGLSNNVVSSILEDDQGNLWIGTDGGGLNYVDRKTGTFSFFKHNANDPESLGSNLVKSIFRDSKGRTWVCTHGGGLNMLNPDKKTFTRYKAGNTGGISSNNILTISEDVNGMLWIGTEDNGLDLFNPESKQFTHYGFKSDNKYRLNANNIGAIIHDGFGQIWLGTENGLFLKKNREQGFMLFDYPFIKNTGFAASMGVRSLYLDSKSQVWVGTRNYGTFAINTKDNLVLQLSLQHGFPSNNIKGMVEDRQGNMWFTTDRGICTFNVTQKEVVAYDFSDGLPGNEFNQNATCMDSRGDIYAGSLNGLVQFTPAQIQKNESINNIVFTGLKIGNESAHPETHPQVLKTAIGNTQEMILRHGQNVFTIEFALLNFIKSSKNNYQYKLDGFEKNWNLSSSGSATYTNLSPGKYRLLVRAANNDGVWNKKEASIFINILPPIWATWWAYLLYVVSLGFLTFMTIRHFWLQTQYKQEKKLQQYKLDFFTNISHEIRTHLTLISTPLDTISEEQVTQGFVQKQLMYIRKHTEKLSVLVAELLDFRKVETGNIKLNFTKYNLVILLREMTSSFDEAAELKKITLHFLAKDKEINAYIDKQQLEKVMNNLLTNALKFTGKGGTVSVEINSRNKEAEIRIRDNGIGIDAKYHKNLFVNYFQVNNHTHENTGYGIGLALSKSIVELHNGSITVESNLARDNHQGMTVFTIRLPLVQPDVEVPSLPTEQEYDTMLSTTSADEEHLQSADGEQELRQTVLVVEDNDELRSFIKDALSPNYQVLEAAHGEEGLRKALQDIPDLVISDVMMPEMDGLELCKRIKNDAKTSHVPVILLTAKSTVSDQIEGLNMLADAYITKPFNFKLLETQMKNLIENRRKLQVRIKQQYLIEDSGFSDQSNQRKEAASVEDEFIQRVAEIVDSNLENLEFNVSVLARLVAMSQPVLYKKIKALTGMSVNDFMKSIRLKKAAALLKAKQYTIYEVAYMVGFSDRKYFSKEFKKVYGVTPSEFESVQ